LLMILRKGWHLDLNDQCALNWDHGLVNCGTNTLCGCWLSRQNDIHVLLHWHLPFQNLSPLISLHHRSSPIFSYLLLSHLQFLLPPSSTRETLINYPSYLSGLLVITQFSSLVFSTQCCTWFWLVCVGLINLTFRVKLGLWSCQLSYQCPSWMLTLLTKRDPGHLSFQQWYLISRFQV
jgi:hypothetical protein